MIDAVDNWCGQKPFARAVVDVCFGDDDETRGSDSWVWPSGSGSSVAGDGTRVMTVVLKDDAGWLMRRGGVVGVDQGEVSEEENPRHRRGVAAAPVRYYRPGEGPRGVEKGHVFCLTRVQPIRRRREEEQDLARQMQHVSQQ